MSILKYAPDLGRELTRFRSCDRCGINMQLHSLSPRRACDDCAEYNAFEWGSFAWLFGRSAAS